MAVGAQIGNLNTSILAYCDDLLLLASNDSHMQLLLDCCLNYATEWKLEFKAIKSISYSLRKTSRSCFKLGTSYYLNLMVSIIWVCLLVMSALLKSSLKRREMFKCERSFYSLRSIGCKTNALNPKSIEFIYKQYCQSIVKFGLKTLYLGQDQLNQLNVKQNILLRNVIVLKYGTRKKCS